MKMLLCFIAFRFSLYMENSSGRSATSQTGSTMNNVLFCFVFLSLFKRGGTGIVATFLGMCEIEMPITPAYHPSDVNRLASYPSLPGGLSREEI